MLVHPEIPGLSQWRPLARGGFAVVWEARQETLDRLVAVKVDSRTLEAEGERRRFLREAGAAGRMSSHPGIVTVHDAGILSDDRPYLVMDLAREGSLTRWLDPEHKPSEEAVRTVGVQIADALAAAHARGVLHRDVKPANILRDSFGNAGLADFGLAHVPGPDDALTPQTLEALTPAYAPPEALAMHSATEQGDVFSLAATLYALLAGRPPRLIDTRTQTVAEVVDTVHEPILPLSQVSPGLMSAIMAGLADRPEDRPTAAEFRDRLAAVNLASGRSASGPPPATSARPGPRRRTGLLAAAAALAALLAGLLIFSLVRPGPTGPVLVDPATPAPGSVAPSSSVASTPSTSTPSEAPTSPSPAPVPAGFTDCRGDLGTAGWCPEAPECWGGVFSYTDSPYQGTPQDCDETHVYQTFAAGPLDVAVRRQSQLEQVAAVEELCTRAVLNRRLIDEQATRRWEIIPIPPQLADDDNLFRCLAGNGERTSPMRLRSAG